jgi:hypothetical protein
MFNELLESSSQKKKTNGSWSVIVSAFIQIAALLVLILIPLIYTQALPKAMLSSLLIAPPPPPAPPPVKAVIKPVARLIQSGRLMQPRAIPKDVAVFKEAELPPDIVNGTNQSGVFGGIPGQGLNCWGWTRSAAAEGCGSCSHQARRRSDGSLDHHSDSPGLSVLGAAGAYSRYGYPARNYRQGRQGCSARSSFGAPPFGAVRFGCRETMAI